MPEIPKVLFLDISETYSAGKDVEVFYAMNGPWTSLEGDWIGLFLAENPNDYIAYENVQISNSTLDPCSVIFPAPCLPRGGAKTFRFSYVTKQGDTIGISSPFHFSAPDASLECSETISDIVVIEREMESSEKMPDELFEMRLEKLESPSIRKQDLKLLEDELNKLENDALTQITMKKIKTQLHSHSQHDANENKEKDFSDMLKLLVQRSERKNEAKSERGQVSEREDYGSNTSQTENLHQDIDEFKLEKFSLHKRLEKLEKSCQLQHQQPKLIKRMQSDLEELAKKNNFFEERLAECNKNLENMVEQVAEAEHNIQVLWESITNQDEEDEHGEVNTDSEDESEQMSEDEKAESNSIHEAEVAEVDADNEEAQTEARLHEGKVESHCTNRTHQNIDDVELENFSLLRRLKKLESFYELHQKEDELLLKEMRDKFEEFKTKNNLLEQCFEKFNEKLENFADHVVEAEDNIQVLWDHVRNKDEEEHIEVNADSEDETHRMSEFELQKSKFNHKATLTDDDATAAATQTKTRFHEAQTEYDSRKKEQRSDATQAGRGTKTNAMKVHRATTIQEEIEVRIMENIHAFSRGRDREQTTWRPESQVKYTQCQDKRSILPPRRATTIFKNKTKNDVNSCPII